MAKVLVPASVALVALSTVFWSIAGVLAFRAGRELHRPVGIDGPRPPLSVLIPVAGEEPRLADHVRAALEALRPEDQLLVGAAAADDPALAIAGRAVGADPRVTLVAGAAARGENRKALALEAMLAQARHGILVVADSDVQLGRDVVERLVSPLASSSDVGLATALYRIFPAGGLGSRLEAATIHGEFVCNVLAARAISGRGGLSFALGAANAVRRECVMAIGGFVALAGHLADDYELGRRVAGQGRRVVLAPCSVQILQTSGLRETLARLLRWARTYRACQPWGYLGTAFTHHGLAASLVLVVLATRSSRVRLLGLVAAFLAARLSAAVWAHRLVDAPLDTRTVLVWPLRDLLGTALFVLAWLGNEVTWRAQRYTIMADGRLKALGPATDCAVRSALSGRAGAERNARRR